MATVMSSVPNAESSDLLGVADLILRTNANHSADAVLDAASEQKEQEQARKKRRWTQQLHRSMQYLNLTERYANPTNSITLVCIDMEAYEFNQNRITEIGISTLHTQDVNQMPPDAQARGWEQYMQTRHIRIDECKHLINSRHIQGCPDYFDFGESEWLSQHDVVAFLTAIFSEAQQIRDGKKVLPVLVGHNIESDVQYMLKTGFDVLAHISDCIDTQDLNKVVRRDNRSRGLGSLLLDYRIKADHLHNAGNDAYYTLRLLLAICEAHYTWPKSSAQWNQEMHEQIKKEIELAEVKVRKQYEGWDDIEPEDEGTGGEAELKRLRLRKNTHVVHSVPLQTQGIPSRGRGRGTGMSRGVENLSLRGRGRGRGFASYVDHDKPVVK